MSLLTGARIPFLCLLGKENGVWTVLLLPLCDHARPWFRFFTQTSLVAGLALCLVAFTRATLVLLYRGENGTAVK